MALESRADLFIRLLVDAFESDLAMRKLGVSVRSKDRSSRFKALCLLDLELAKEELDPVNFSRMMHYAPSDDSTDRFDQSH